MFVALIFFQHNGFWVDLSPYAPLQIMKRFDLMSKRNLPAPPNGTYFPMGIVKVPLIMVESRLSISVAKGVLRLEKGSNQ